MATANPAAAVVERLGSNGLRRHTRRRSFRLAHATERSDRQSLGADPWPGSRFAPPSESKLLIERLGCLKGAREGLHKGRRRLAKLLYLTDSAQTVSTPGTIFRLFLCSPTAIRLLFATEVVISRLVFITFVVYSGVAGAAALVPVPGANLPLPAALEPNRGQANGEILFLKRGTSSLGVTASAVVYSPFGVRLTLLASNSNPAVRFTDPLPGVVHSLAGTNPQRWVTGIPRYGAAILAGVYPGINAQYSVAGEQLILTLTIQPGASLPPELFEIDKATDVVRDSDGALRARLGTSRIDPIFVYAPPSAFQETPAGRVSRRAAFEVRSANRFGLQVDGRDPAMPLQIEIRLAVAPVVPTLPNVLSPVADSEGNTFIASVIADAAGKSSPFPTERSEGCGATLGYPIACSDVAVYRYGKNGELVFVSYLEGKTREAPGFLGIAADGSLVIAGTTDSADFPISITAAQRTYGGPAPTPAGSSTTISGDFFAAKLDPGTGMLRASTYLGGPNGDTMGAAALGLDGSLYFMPASLGQFSARMPVTPGSLQGECTGDPCLNGYAARMGPALDRLLYGTYLPGTPQATAKLHSDGSMYYAGRAGPGLPTSPTAYQRQSAGKEDGMVARLDPLGRSLLFATYLGTPETDWILRLAVAPDGSAWAALSSFVQCCTDIDYRLVRLDGRGERVLVQKPIDVGDMVVDRDGNLIATAAGKFVAGPDAFLENACGSPLAYLRLRPDGEQLFASYLPGGTDYNFYGLSARGAPVLRKNTNGVPEDFEIVEGESVEAFVGCLADAASFNVGIFSPGALVTIFGSRMGPRDGIGFRLQDSGLPISLGGTRVLVNGEPVPLLYVSYSQINFIVPYSLPVGTLLTVQVESRGVLGNRLDGLSVPDAFVTLFRVPDSPTAQALALNEDGTVNSSANPARKGSRVVLFGTGGGATVPPSVAGEVTPLETRRLAQTVQVKITDTMSATVEYAGAAPGLLAGVTQINIKLPDEIPEVPNFPRNVVPLVVLTLGPSYHYSPYVTIAVSTD